MEHPQMRNGFCTRRSHVGVLTPRARGRMEHVISEEWSIPGCEVDPAHATRTWAFSVSRGIPLTQLRTSTSRNTQYEIRIRISSATYLAAY